MWKAFWAALKPAPEPTPKPVVVVPTTCWSDTALGKLLVPALLKLKVTSASNLLGLRRQRLAKLVLENKLSGQSNDVLLEVISEHAAEHAASHIMLYEEWRAAKEESAGSYYYRTPRAMLDQEKSELEREKKELLAWANSMCIVHTADGARGAQVPAIAGANNTTVYVSDSLFAERLKQWIRIPPVYSKNSSRVATANTLHRAMTYAELAWHESKPLVSFARMVGVDIDCHRAVRDAKAFSGKMYEYVFPAGAFADLYWLSNHVGDQLTAGLIALTFATHLGNVEETRCASARVSAYVRSDLEDKRISQAFDAVLTEMWILEQEWAARRNGAYSACEESDRAANSIGENSPGAAYLYRAFSAAVATELFENCRRRANARAHASAETGTKVCRNLVTATILS